MRETRNLTIRELSSLAKVNKETIRRVESGTPCSNRTREKLRKVLDTSLQRLCLLSNHKDPRIAIHRVNDTTWTISRDLRPSVRKVDPEILPFTPIESNGIQDDQSRSRLGRRGFATRFLKLLNCDRSGGHIFAGLMEIFNGGDAKTHSGEEFIYCIRGAIRIHLNGVEYILTEGSAATFDARLPTIRASVACEAR